MTDETVQTAEETPAEEPQRGITLAEHFVLNYRILEGLLVDPLTNKGHKDAMRERLVQVALNLTVLEAR